MKQGSLAIDNKNIFAILKKWLYTEEHIVFRELVSNASDAINKRKVSDDKDFEGKIEVIVDSDKNTISIKDNGIGMTSSEIEKYINTIAFSGAKEFVDKISNSDNVLSSQGMSNNSIIGHFGVGFYSAFMVSDYVTIESLSYIPGSKGVFWNCNSDMEFTMEDKDKSDIGTIVTLHLDENSVYLKKPELLQSILKEYFYLLPIEIVLVVNKDDTTTVNGHLNFWKDLENMDEENLSNFYKEFFNDPYDPIYNIKITSPDIGLQGVIFFRATRDDTRELDGEFKIYNNGVYIGSNISSLIPKFLNLQSGIIECKNLPLVVSRSDFRESENNEENIFKLIQEALVQEVAIAFNDLYENKRKQYEELWPNLNAFLKYGILQDNTLASVMTRKVIFKDNLGNYTTIGEMLNTDDRKVEAELYYTSDPISQAAYLQVFKEEDIDVLFFDHVIDQPFMRRLGMIYPNISFIRVDSQNAVIYKDILSEEDKQNYTQLKESIENILQNHQGVIDVEITKLKSKSLSMLIVNDEESRRLADMLEIYGVINAQDTNQKFKQSKGKLLVNISNDVIKFVLSDPTSDKSIFILDYLCKLAILGQDALSQKEMMVFLKNSRTLLDNYIK